MAKEKKPKYIEPTQEELAFFQEELFKYFSDLKHIGKFDGDVEKRFWEVIEACKVGWKNCPHKFIDRIRMKTGWRNKNRSNLVSWGEAKKINSAQEAQMEREIEEIGKKDGKIEPSDEIIHQIGRDQIIRKLKSDDRKFWLAREKFYRKEFEFNDSSDFALLMELLSDELEHKRIVQMRLTTTDPEELAYLSKAGTECFNRMEKAQKALGVTREQRKDEIDNAGGDIATLSMHLDEKIKALEKIKDLDVKERQEYLAKKFQRGDCFIVEGIERPLHDRIPDMEEIARIEKEAGLDD